MEWIWIRSKFDNNYNIFCDHFNYLVFSLLQRFRKRENYNLFIEYELKERPSNKETILNEINKIFDDFQVKKIEINNNVLEVMGSVSLNGTKQIDELDKYFDNKAKISFSEDNVYF